MKLFAGVFVCSVVVFLAGCSGEPPMTRFVAKEMATDHWFDITAARRDLAYHPLMTVADGVKDLVAHYRAGNHF